MALWPTRGQKAPNFWDLILKNYIDTGDAANVTAVETAAEAAEMAGVAAGEVALRATALEGTVNEGRLSEDGLSATFAAVFTPEKYGAMGDGTTDDATALNAAATAARAVEGTLLLKTGSTYIVGSRVNVAGVNVQGYGATVKLKSTGTAANYNAFTQEGSAKTTIRGLTFDGNKANNLTDGNDFTGCGIVANDATWEHLTVEDCTFQNFHRNGMTLRTPEVADTLDVAASRTTIRGCTFTDVRIGIYALQITDMLIEDNRFDTLALHGIALYGGLRPVITKNKIDGTGGNGISTLYCAFEHVTNNDSRNNVGQGIAIGGGDPSKSPGHDGVISGNVCEDNGSNGITLDPTLEGADYTPIDVNHKVVGNTCNRNGVHGIYLQNAGAVTVTGNQCDENTLDGLAISSPRATLTGNKCRGNTGYGVSMNGNALANLNGYHRLAGNQVYGNTAGQYFTATAFVPDVLFAPEGAKANRLAYPPGRTGFYYRPASVSQLNGNLPPGDLHLTAIELPACTLTRIAISVTSAGGAGNTIRLGIYTDNEGVPGSLILDAGTVLGTAVANPELTISQAITGGRYWLAASSTGGTTPQVLRGTMPQQNGASLAEVFAGYGLAGYAFGHASGTLPATLPNFGGLANGPAMAVKVA